MPQTHSDSLPFNLVRSEYAENSIKHALTDGRITESDAKLIRAFCAEMQATNDISTTRVNKITFTLVALRRFVGEFQCNSAADIYLGVPTIKSAVTKRGVPYKQNTIVDLIKILKQFYTWAINNGFSQIPLEKIKALKNPAKNEMTKTAADMLTPEEVITFIRSCKTDRDRAFFMMMYEGGFRVGEVGQLTWAQVKFDEFGVIVNVDFKTGKPRYVRLIMAREYLAAWKASYNDNPDGSALVFLNKNNQPLTHAQVLKQIQRISSRAGITKHIIPHIFRHSRITHLIQEGMQESVVKKMMWGTVDSRMFKSYLHLTGQDIDREVLRMYGLEIPKAQQKRNMAPRQCPHCQTINSPLSNFCNVCGYSLTPDAQSQEGLLQRVWVEKPEITQKWAQVRVSEKAAD